MTRLPDLQDQLVRAARRRERRRRLRSWRSITAGTAIAVTISGAALAATGTPVPVLSGGGGQRGGPPRLVPKDVAAALRVAFADQVLALLNRANEDVFTAQPRCRPGRPFPARTRRTHAVPPPAILAQVAALRRPATAADRRARESKTVRYAGGEVYVDYVRVVRTSTGHTEVIVPSRGRAPIFRPKPGCLDAQHDRLVAVLAHRAPRLRSATLAEFSKFRQGQERNLRLPQTRMVSLGLGGVGATDARSFRVRGLFGSSSTAGGPTRLIGLVPDGVATINLHFPRKVSRGRDYRAVHFPTTIDRTVRVRQNLIAIRVARPVEGAFPTRMVWRDARGHVVRVIRDGR